MKTWAGIAAVMLMLAGCSGPAASGGDNNHVVPAEPRQPVENTTKTAVPQPSPSAEVTASAEVLKPEALKEHFGFADEAGKYILLTGTEEGQEETLSPLNRAIGKDGQELHVSFVKWQPGSGDSNGRDMANNFAHVPGYLFQVEEGSATADETYYLADAKDFNTRSLLEVKPVDPEHSKETAADDVKKAIAEAKKREIQYIGKIADFSPGGQLYAVQFVRQKQDMLFSLVLQEGDSFVFMDYPAVIENGNEYSVWRVDDGGEITADMFSVLFAARTRDGVLLGINWWGAEGVNTFFLNQQGHRFKELDIQYGRYTSPL